MIDQRIASPSAAAVAGFALPRVDGGPVEVAGVDWSSFLTRLSSERLSGLATAAWQSDALRISPAQIADLLDVHRESMLWALKLERELLRIGEFLGERDIPFIVLKGPAVAHTVYPDPSWRPFGDLDLLIRTQDWRGACRVLERLGFTRGLPEPRPGFDERFGKGAMHRNLGGMEIDLHRTLALGPFGLWMRPEDIFERSTVFTIGGRTFRRPDDTYLLLHACVHACLGNWPPRLLALRDVAQIALAGAVDWDGLSRRAERWRLASVVSLALDTAQRTFEVPLPDPAGFLRRRVSRGERRVLDGYTRRRKEGGTVVSALRAIPGVRAKAGYLWALLVPNRTFLAARTGSSHPSYLRRWLVPFRWASRRWRREASSR